MGHIFSDKGTVEVYLQQYGQKGSDVQHKEHRVAVSEEGPVHIQTGGGSSPSEKAGEPSADGLSVDLAAQKDPKQMLDNMFGQGSAEGMKINKGDAQLVSPSPSVKI